jgi:hypothetical protein
LSTERLKAYWSLKTMWRQWMIWEIADQIKIVHSQTKRTLEAQFIWKQVRTTTKKQQYT